jgi:Spy/CpxP family protein refolding chaperone
MKMNKRALLFVTAMLVVALPLAHRAATQTPSNDPLHHEQGRGGLQKDDREAARLFKLAADQGDADAQSALERLARRSGISAL